MNDEETVDEVVRLLEMLPGTRLMWRQESPTMVRLGMQILDPHSVSTLAHIVTWTNTPLEVEIDWTCSSKHDAPECVRYDLRVPVRPDQDDPIEQLKLIGKCLAYAHHENDQMELEEAKRVASAFKVHRGFRKK